MAKQINCKWSDGTPFVLRKGQTWKSPDENDYTLEILETHHDKVIVLEVEIEETYDHELDGPDGFVDFLEQNGYRLYH